METTTTGFDGAAGRLAGPVMARMNRDMELVAIHGLAPGPDDSVLAIGFGPGVGIAELVKRLPDGVIGGIDPSASMLQQARRRNRTAVESGQVLLERSTAASIPWPDGTFHGVLAVNSMQLWQPLDASVREVVRVLTPGAVLVTVTHAWAIEKRVPIDEWVRETSDVLRRSGCETVTDRKARFRSGDGVLLTAKKPLLCNQTAPGPPLAERYVRRYGGNCGGIGA